MEWNEDQQGDRSSGMRYGRETIEWNETNKGIDLVG